MMKTFSYSPLFIALAAVTITLAGCAAPPSQKDGAKAPMQMCMADKDRMGHGGCACCDMGMKEMSPEMKQKHMEMMQKMSPEMKQKHMEMMRQHHPEMMHEKMSPQPSAR